MNYDVIIIGAGPAGLTAGIYARTRKLRTLILEAGEAGGQLVSLYPDKGVNNYPGCVFTQAKKLAQRMIAHAEQMGCEIHENEKVIDILDEEGILLVKTELNEYRAKAVIIAIGIGLFKPKRLGIPGENELEGRGVFYKLPEKSDLVDKRLIFVGGGNSALEMALIASEVAAETYIIHRRDVFRADEINVEKVKNSSIKTIMNSWLSRIEGKEKVEKVVIEKEGKEQIELEADYVIISIGYTPELKELEKWNLKLEDTQIVVDTEMRTSRHGVFACGDIVYYPGKYKQIVTACGEGATAANSAYKFIKKPYWA